MFQGTHAAETLAQSIRSAVSDMFDAMDAVAYKADMMQVGWMKLGLNRVSMTGYGILRITGNVTEFTRYQQSDPRSFLKLSAVNLAVLLEQLRPEVEKLSGMAGIPVEFPHSHDLPYLLLDTAQFQLAFYNLLHNCISYTKPENRIDISLQKKEDGVALTITDRGLGIPTDQLETVLRPYHTYRHNGGRVGAGLGLSLVQLITEAHAGKLSIRSSAGEGTAATLLFPRISFTQPLPLAQPTFARAVPDRFSAAYVGLVDAVYQANPEQSLSPQIGPAGQGLSL